MGTDYISVPIIYNLVFYEIFSALGNSSLVVAIRVTIIIILILLSILNCNVQISKGDIGRLLDSNLVYFNGFTVGYNRSRLTFSLNLLQSERIFIFKIYNS